MACKEALREFISSRFNTIFLKQFVILAKQIEKNKEEEQLQELDERRIRIIKQEIDRYELQHMIRIGENNKKEILDIVAVAGKKV